MNVKTYLNQIRKLDILIRQKQEQLQELRSKAEGQGSVDYAADRVQTSPVDSLSENVAAFVDLQSEIENTLRQYIRTKSMIIDQIQQLEDTRYIEILYKRYVEYKNITVVAYEMGYEYTWLCHLHGDALNAFAEKHMKNTSKHSAR